MKHKFYYMKAALILQFFFVLLFAFPIFINAPSTALVIIGVVLLAASLFVAVFAGIALLKSRETGGPAAKKVTQYLKDRYWTQKDLDSIQRQLEAERRIAKEV